MIESVYIGAFLVAAGFALGLALPLVFNRWHGPKPSWLFALAFPFVIFIQAAGLLVFGYFVKDLAFILWRMVRMLALAIFAVLLAVK